MRKALLLSGVCLLQSLLQAQCPPNINFSSGSLTNWSAFTSNFAVGGILQNYPANSPAPSGTDGVTSINEYNDSRTGIQIITNTGKDEFGFFDITPTINGYTYSHVVQLGSTATTSGRSVLRGGYIRGISYVIDVPTGDVSEPYIITYAYAMVVENGSHSTVNQPIIKVTLQTPTGPVSCASAVYNLPTIFTTVINNNNGQLDSLFNVDESIAAAQGFNLSSTPSPNVTGRPNESLIRVWTKGWTEVMFNLSPYRGQQVTLNFESDNCIPGGHFAYSYIALRDECGGLKISGPDKACEEATATYSIPSLANGSYNWNIPPGWQLVSSGNSNIISVKPGTAPGNISVIADNGCTRLTAFYPVEISPPTLAGKLNSDAAVCTGTNSTQLNLSGHRGNVLKWIASTDGISWKEINNKTITYTAQNLTATTIYRVLVQNGGNCNIDTSAAATIKVFEKSEGGKLTPSNINVCLNQNKDAVLQLNDHTGDIVNWQWSQDNISWNNFNPVYQNPSFNIKDQTQPVIYYRSLVQVGVCPVDVSTTAKVSLINVAFPEAKITPADTVICYGDKVNLTTTIETGTSYEWLNTSGLTGTIKNNLSSNPYTFTVAASPIFTTRYPIQIFNNGCPNALTDTFVVRVNPLILPFAGNDTAIVANQPLQLNVSTSYETAFIFQWQPSTGLSGTTVPDPVALLGTSTDRITYKVFVTDPESGCTESDMIHIKVFKTGPEIFVPSAFTPNNDQLNDILKPTPAGISSFSWFRVFNRYGQLLFSTNMLGKGWDGTYNGVNQPQGVYVWTISATDYKGTLIQRKGTTMLIR